MPIEHGFKMISAVVLAAGESSRIKGCKQLLKIGGKPLLQHVLDNIRGSRVGEIVVVLGFMAEKIMREVSMSGVKVVVNRWYKSGMSSSLRLGLKAVSRDADAFIVILGDQPFINPDLISRIIEEYERSNGLIILPSYQDRRGNPVLFDKSLLQEVLKIRGDVGARSVVKRHYGEVHEVKVDSPNILLDIDTVRDVYDARRIYQTLHSYG